MIIIISYMIYQGIILFIGYLEIINSNDFTSAEAFLVPLSLIPVNVALTSISVIFLKLLFNAVATVPIDVLIALNDISVGNFIFDNGARSSFSLVNDFFRPSSVGIKLFTPVHAFLAASETPVVDVIIN